MTESPGPPLLAVADPRATAACQECDDRPTGSAYAWADNHISATGHKVTIPGCGGAALLMAAAVKAGWEATRDEGGCYADAWHVARPGWLALAVVRLHHEPCEQRAVVQWSAGTPTGAWLARRGHWEATTVTKLRKHLVEHTNATRGPCPRCSAPTWSGTDQGGGEQRVRVDADPAPQDPLHRAVLIASGTPLYQMLPAKGGRELWHVDPEHLTSTRWPAHPAHHCPGEPR